MTIKFFWETLIQKIKSKLEIWKTRDLSFEGKSLLIRSIAVSQILYAIEMKSIDEKYTNDVNKILFDFLWSGKRYNINKAICNLPRQMGGLNIVDMQTLIKVKRVQWVIRTLKEQTGQNWAKLIENHLRCLDNVFKIEFFTLKVTDSADLITYQNIPIFYKECISYFQEMIRKGKCESTDSIIWCNDKYRFNGKTLQIAHWSKSGIKMMSDLYQNNIIRNENSIKNKLKHKAGFIFEMKQIKKTLPNRLNMSDSNQQWINGGKDVLLQQEFLVPEVGIKSLSDLTAKDIYNIFLLNKFPVMPSKQYWLDKFQLDNINWESWFSVNLTNKLLPRKCKDFNWKVFHGLVNTEVKLKHMKYSDGFCKVCRSGLIENLEHLIYECPNSYRIWNNVEEIIKKWLGFSYTMGKIQSLAGVWETKSNTISAEVLIINVLASISRYHLWKVRSSIRYGNESISFTGSARMLKWSLVQHMKLLKLTSLSLIISDHVFS